VHDFLFDRLADDDAEVPFQAAFLLAACRLRKRPMPSLPWPPTPRPATPAWTSPLGGTLSSGAGSARYGRSPACG
jgi:hypothetical protein